ncbi:DUF58 domain-containing protein [Nibricoccus aquaticus]|uniref:DUF58 domain-containing protein n=1 Tax=Nibricoccus aquaticus TaxID=2576891 RepID=A0A290QDV5_9BACT|nr:DUF58 domain-containing protein [Nibricoccus aquaticus]ATC62521.1 DUF58 domain-containing protein [Nibricoccus aquaticus]
MPSAPDQPAAPLQNPLALLRRLEWRVRHAVENVLSGEYRSAFRGRGMEFDQVVKYAFGDDVRDIDWNVTARLGEPYRKKFVEEREVTLMIVLEDTPSLQFGSGAQSKREALLELAGLVMLLGAVNRDRVGCIHASPTGYTFREPVRGRGPILHAAATLLSQPPPDLSTLNPQLSTGSPSPAATAIPWRLISKTAPKHSILIWLGDFAARPAPDGWPLMQRRYQTMGFRVDDPWDRELPAGDSFAAYDPVNGRLVTIEGSSAERAAHAEWRDTRDTSFRALFPDPQSRLVVGTDEPRLEALVKFFHRRMAGSSR